MSDHQKILKTSLSASPDQLRYSNDTLYDAFRRTASKYPNKFAYEYMGTKTRYSQMKSRVSRCANALLALGIRRGDKVTICLPNIPQAVDVFYAVNRIGAIANMVHPLSAENEIAYYLEVSGSVAILALDQFADKVLKAARSVAAVKHIIITGPEDTLPVWKKQVFRLSKGKVFTSAVPGCISYEEFLSQGKYASSGSSRAHNDHAVILYSGGTTGTSKGILLTNRNFNAIAQQVVAANPVFQPGDKMLAVLPMFHGFGLGVCIHTMMFNGGCSILVPRFTLKTYAQLLSKYSPNFIAGVPTLFEALIMLENVKDLDLSCLKGVFSGGDSLSVDLKKKIDDFLYEHNSKVPIREGYGLTECCSVACLTPSNSHKDGSIGKPMPDVSVKIVAPGTEEIQPVGAEGEICISGPTVMLGYIGNEKETGETLISHSDGRTWLHTGDLGKLDEDGYLFFSQRIKRMIVTSGYNVYPSQIESVLDAHPKVLRSCVIGVDDPYRIKKVKAFIVLDKGAEKSEKTKEEILEYVKLNIAKYAMPREIEFRDELPKTRVGKIAYRVLEEEEAAKQKA